MNPAVKYTFAPQLEVLVDDEFVELVQGTQEECDAAFTFTFTPTGVYKVLNTKVSLLAVVDVFVDGQMKTRLSAIQLAEKHARGPYDTFGSDVLLRLSSETCMDATGEYTSTFPRTLIRVKAAVNKFALTYALSHQ